MNDGRRELLVLNDKTVAKIADAAEASERSVWKRLAGGRVRGRVQGRIDRAIAAARAARFGPDRGTELTRRTQAGLLRPWVDEAPDEPERTLEGDPRSRRGGRRVRSRRGGVERGRFFPCVFGNN